MILLPVDKCLCKLHLPQTSVLYFFDFFFLQFIYHLQEVPKPLIN